MFHHIISNGLYKVPTSHTFTSIIPFSLSPYSFYSFFMSDMKCMGEFGFTLTHVSLKSSPSASYFDQFFLQQLHERYLHETTCTIDLFHTLLQCLRLEVQAEVDNMIEDKNIKNVSSSPARLYVTPPPPEPVVCPIIRFIYSPKK